MHGCNNIIYNIIIIIAIDGHYAIIAEFDDGL